MTDTNFSFLLTGHFSAGILGHMWITQKRTRGTCESWVFTGHM